jgi:hypothetical protein
MPFMPVPSLDKPRASHDDMVLAASTKVMLSPAPKGAEALPGESSVHNKQLGPNLGLQSTDELEAFCHLDLPRCRW